VEWLGFRVTKKFVNQKITDEKSFLAIQMEDDYPHDLLKRKESLNFF
jgi:hypothetical protein